MAVAAHELAGDDHDRPDGEIDDHLLGPADGVLGVDVAADHLHHADQQRAGAEQADEGLLDLVPDADHAPALAERDHLQVLTPRSCITSLTISGETLISRAIASCCGSISLREAAVSAAEASTNSTPWLSMSLRELTCPFAVLAR